MAEVHDGDPVCNMTHHVEIVRHHQDRQADLVLQSRQQVQNLALHRYIEPGRRLVGQYQLGIERESAGDPDAPGLAAGKLVRVALTELGWQADRSEEHTSELQSLMRISYAVF